MLNINQLFNFIDRAGRATYTGNGKYEEHPERSRFYELVYEEPPWQYRDSYTGHARSGGQEIVRYDGTPVWWSGYGGGMVEGKENLSDQTFEFLKKALSEDEEGFQSLRGPHSFSSEDWEYTYTQEGDITDFYGYEEISYKGEKVFWHRAVGGTLIQK